MRRKKSEREKLFTKYEKQLKSIISKYKKLMKTPKWGAKESQKQGELLTKYFAIFRELYKDGYDKRLDTDAEMAETMMPTDYFRCFCLPLSITRERLDFFYQQEELLKVIVIEYQTIFNELVQVPLINPDELQKEERKLLRQKLNELKQKYFAIFYELYKNGFDLRLDSEAELEEESMPNNYWKRFFVSSNIKIEWANLNADWPTP